MVRLGWWCSVVGSQGEGQRCIEFKAKIHCRCGSHIYHLMWTSVRHHLLQMHPNSTCIKHFFLVNDIIMGLYLVGTSCLSFNEHVPFEWSAAPLFHPAPSRMVPFWSYVDPTEELSSKPDKTRKHELSYSLFLWWRCPGFLEQTRASYFEVHKAHFKWIRQISSTPKRYNSLVIYKRRD